MISLPRQHDLLSGCEPELFKPENRFIYCYPFVEQLEADGEKLFREIIVDTHSALECEVQSSRLLETSNKFDFFLKFYGLKFSSDCHVELVKLYYGILTLDGLDVDNFAISVNILWLLVKKQELIKADLMLDWKPLYNSVKKTVFSRIEGKKYWSITKNLRRVIQALSRYFNPYSTKEIMDEFFPRLCPFSGEMCHYAKCINWFLPVSNFECSNIWFLDIMKLWNMSMNSFDWEYEVMWLMARFAENNIGKINWEPYMPFLFSKFLKNFKLPISFSEDNRHEKYFHHLECSSIATWIVSILGKESSGQMNLNYMLKALETYFEPPNYGRWSNLLWKFVHKLTESFINRLFKERIITPKQTNPIPNDKKLSEDDVDEFVKTIQPIAMKGIADANFFIIQQLLGQMLYNLALLRPALVIPPIVEMLQKYTLEMSEHRKFTSILGCLIFTMRPMVEGLHNGYPEGPSTAINIIGLLVPSLENNDPRKLVLAIKYITTITKMLPKVTILGKYQNEPLDEFQEKALESLKVFEEVVLVLFERCLSLADSSAVIEFKLDSEINFSPLSEIVSLIDDMCFALASWAPQEIVEISIKKLNMYLGPNVDVKDVLISTILRTFSQVRPDIVLNVSLLSTCNNIMNMINSDGTYQEGYLEKEVAFWLKMLSEIVDCKSKKLIPFLPLVCTVLDASLNIDSRIAREFAVKSLKNVLTSISSISPICDASILSTFHDMDWGCGACEEDLIGMKWHFPGLKEVSECDKIINRYFTPTLNILKESNNGDLKLDRQARIRNLEIMCACLQGCRTLLPIWVENDHFNSKMSGDTIISVFPKGINLDLSSNTNIRKEVINHLGQFQDSLLISEPDDVSCLIKIIELWGLLIHAKDLTSCDPKRLCIDKMETKIYTNPFGKRKKHTFSKLMLKLKKNQALLETQSISHITATHIFAIKKLFSLVICSYRKVRIPAQEELFKVINIFPQGVNIVVNEIESVLRESGHKTHVCKGVLHTLLGPKTRPIIIDFKVCLRIWPLLISCKMDPSVQLVKLFEELKGVLNKKILKTSVKCIVTKECTTSALKLLSLSNSSFEVLVNNKELNYDATEQSYFTLWNNILNAVKCFQIDWRHEHFALTLIESLATNNVNYSKDVARYIMGSLIHENKHLREIATKCCIRMYYQIRRQPVKKYEETAILIKNAVHPTFGEPCIPEWCKLGVMNDLDYIKKSHFVNSDFGFIPWPSVIPVYSDINLEPEFSDYHDVIMEFQACLKSHQYLKTLINYMNESGDKKTFNKNNAIIFKVFSSVGGSMIVDNINQQLTNLVTDEKNQIIVLEIMSGIIKGSKHWPSSDRHNVWLHFKEILYTALTHFSPHNMEIWACFYLQITRKTMPSRIPWLYQDLVSGIDFECHSSIKDSASKMLALEKAMTNHEWKLWDLNNVLLERIRPHLSNEYQLIRVRIAGLLVHIFRADLDIKYCTSTMSPKVEDFIEFVNYVCISEISYKDDTNLTEDVTTKESSSRQNDILSYLSFTDFANKKVINLLKTVAVWIIHGASNVLWCHSSIYQLLPYFIYMENQESDPELKVLGKQVLCILSESLCSEEYVTKILYILEKISHCKSWSGRISGLGFLETWSFYHIVLLKAKPHWCSKVLDIVLHLIQDSRSEVRLKAGKVLSGMIHCSIPNDPTHLMNVFKNMLESGMMESTLDKKHGGVLGLCAFISACPYTIPQNMDVVLKSLLPYFNSSYLLRDTIKTTMSDFKRTHMGKWEEIKEKFVDIFIHLEDLSLPPSHYA